MFFFFAALVVTIALILILERFARPAKKRPFSYNISMLSAMPTLVFYTTIFMISYRPLFSSLATLVVFTGIIVVNNAKVAILREPLVFTDFALLRQAIRYPALYIKYVGVGKVVAVVTAGLAAIFSAVSLEKAVIVRNDFDDYFPLIIYLAVVCGMIFAITRGPFRRTFADTLRRFGPTANVTQDRDKLPLVVCLIFYFFLANEPEHKQPARRRLERRVALRRRPVLDMPRGDVVVVQSESFFDARRLHESIPRDLLTTFDACAAESSYQGRLSVPAWGANTMRTEFAFLSGLPSEALGYHQFNPYLTLCQSPVWTVAHLFRSMGYRTICLHPFHGSFFDRKTVIPNLGFDLLLDLADFADAPTFGPYVSDTAVADRIVSLLEADHPRPFFIFAITMENHGKWEKGRLDDQPADPAIGEAPLGSPDLGLYLRHLRNTDALVERLWRYLKSRPQDGTFCLFGDHLPPLAKVFDAVAQTDPRTDYFIWRKNAGQRRALDTSADILGRLVLDAALSSLRAEAAPPEREA